MSVLTTTMIKLAVFYVTAPSRQVAVKLSQILLSQKLIACCNIVDNVQSVYMWQGKMENQKQVLMIMKSRQELADQITKTVTSNHPYEVPEVIAMPILTGSGKYIDWVIQNTKSADHNQAKVQQKGSADVEEIQGKQGL